MKMGVLRFEPVKTIKFSVNILSFGFGSGLRLLVPVPGAAAEDALGDEQDRDRRGGPGVPPAMEVATQPQHAEVLPKLAPRRARRQPLRVCRLCLRSLVAATL